MRFSKRVFAFGMVLLAFLIDTAIIPFEAKNPMYYPKFTLLVIMTIALLMGRTQGILYGMIGGALMDVTLMIPTGLVSLLYTIAGFLSGYIGRKMRVRILSSVIAPVVAMLIYEAVMSGYFYFSGGLYTAQTLIASAVRTAIGCVIIQLLYILFALVLKPKHSRYAKR